MSTQRMIADQLVIKVLLLLTLLDSKSYSFAGYVSGIKSNTTDSAAVSCNYLCTYGHDLPYC